MKSSRVWVPALALACACSLSAQAAKSKKSNKKGAAAPAATSATPTAVSSTSTGLPAPEPPPAKTTVVEQIVARVNDRIITTSDYQNAVNEMQEGLEQQAKQSGKPLTADDLAKAKKDLLSTLIDNDLLEEKAADMGLSADTDTIMQLDQMRQQNHLASMEDLQKAIEAQGMNYEDFQQSIKNQILQRKVIEQDVAPRVSASTPKQIEDYYNAHKADFVRPDEVALSEILISTQDKPDAEKKRLKDLADQVQQHAARGEDFAKLAQKYSNASTAADGGDIGFEKRDQLDSKLADELFALPVGGVSRVETVPNGYLILKVTAVHHAGQETLQEATNEIDNILYQQAIRPELQTYLANLRRDAFITVKPGYVDTGAVAASNFDITKFQRVLPSDLPKPTDKDKKGSGFNMSGGGE